jgi:dTDP-4-dehydrorhamnose reductase
MKVLITGAAGTVGSGLVRRLRDSGFDIVGVDRKEAPGLLCADLLDARWAGSLFEEHDFDAVVHLAANKNVADCEKNPHAAHRVNYEMSARLADLCEAHGVGMIFLSSDYVFGAEDRLWREEDDPRPTTQYGRDKAAAERYLLSCLSSISVVRTAGLYGFPGDLVSVVRSVLGRGETFEAFENLINCPTYMGDLCGAVARLLEHRQNGIFHCVGPEAMSRYDYAFRVAEAFHLPTSQVVKGTLDIEADCRPASP